MTLNFDLIKSELENGLSYESSINIKNNENWNKCNRFDLVLVKLVCGSTSADTLERYKPIDVINQFNTYYRQENRPSKLVNFDLMIDFLDKRGTLKIKHRCLIPITEFKKIRFDIPNTPSISIIMKIHLVCPWLCGYLFEELFNLAVNNVYPNLILTYEHEQVIPDLHINNIRPILTELANCVIDYYNPISRIACKNDIYYALLSVFIKQIKFVKCFPEFYYQFLQLFNCVKSNLYEVEYYFETLKTCQFVNTIKNAEHSVKVNNFYNGEIDFLTNDSIIDIKCCIKDNIEKYHYQLMYYYASLPVNVSANITKLIIVNLIENQIYVYNVSPSD